MTNTQMIITIGRSTYSVAVKDMVKSAILPDIYVHETLNSFQSDTDLFLETALELRVRASGGESLLRQDFGDHSYELLLNYY